MAEIKLVATDLDGTFLKNDHSICPNNLKSLSLLGEKGIKRVIATGRNLKKVEAVIPSSVPFDYVVYSSGAGIYDCKSSKHIFTKNIDKNTSTKLAEILVEMDVSFNAFHAVPQNHQLWYFRGDKACKEFDDYFQFHNSHAEPFPGIENFNRELCQFLIILPNDESQFLKLKNILLKKFKGIGVIRTTSPLHSGNIWMEVFHKTISKGNAIAWLCDKLKIEQAQTLGIGNDYNDIELLDYTHYAYLTSNGPDILKPKYLAAPSNEESAFTYAVNQHV